MPELVRTVISYLSGVVGSRNCAPRRVVHLPLSISLVDPQTPTRKDTRLHACSARTEDISTTGLSFTVPSVWLGGRRLFGEPDAYLRIELELPDGRVSLCAKPVRYELLERDGYAVSYLIGARIIEMGSGERARLLSYLRKPKRPVRAGHTQPASSEPASTYGV